MDSNTSLNKNGNPQDLNELSAQSHGLALIELLSIYIYSKTCYGFSDPCSI